MFFVSVQRLWLKFQQDVQAKSRAPGRQRLVLSEGYAMTEDFACSHTCTLERRAPGAVGIPLPGAETRIAADGFFRNRPPASSACGCWWRRAIPGRRTTACRRPR